MDEYNFYPSLNSMSDNRRVSAIRAKKRNSLSRNTRAPIELDATFHNEFVRELALMKIKFPFLTESQVQGRTLDKFCIPNLMGKPYKKKKSGEITMCTIRYAIQTAKKSETERKFRSDRRKNDVQRRHTIDGSYFPIDITINKIRGRINSKVSKKLFDNFTLYSENMEDDNYSIQESNTDESELEDFHPEIHTSHTFELNFMNKPSETAKPVKTYEKVKHCASNNSDISGKGNQSYHQRNLKQAKNEYSKHLKPSEVSERKLSKHSSTVDRNDVEIIDLTQDLQNMMSDYEVIENSVDTLNGTTHIDERQKIISESLHHNSSVSSVSKSIRIGNKCVWQPEFHRASPTNCDFISSNVRKRRKKVSISNQQAEKKANHHSSSKRIKQSISQVSLEFLENVSTSCSSSDSKDLNPGYLCGVKCLLAPKPQVPLAKVNLSVWSQNKDSVNNLKGSTKNPTGSLGPLGVVRKYRKCSEGAPYIDEASPNNSSENRSDSSESPMRETDEEENESNHLPDSYRKRKSSCSSIESYPIMHQGRYSPHIIQLHSSQGTLSESSGEENNMRESSYSHSMNDDFGELRGNFSPQNTTMQDLPGDDNSISPTTSNSQQNEQLSQRMAQVVTTVDSEMRTSGNNAPHSDGYFLANLFDEYTNQRVRRTLRSSVEQFSSSNEDDGVLIVD